MSSADAVPSPESCLPVSFLPQDDRQAAAPQSGLALCLSGGGFRAMLFHLGAMLRLNEAGLLPKLDRISSVSGGSITAGLLGQKWSRLRFDDTGVAANLQRELVEPLRALAGRTIDRGAIGVGALLPGVSIGDRIEAAYRKYLFGNATLQSLPDRPRFVINATNVQSGVLWRFMRPYMRDYRVGEVRIPTVSLAKAGVNELDYVIATHYDSDHIGGIIAGQPHMHGASFILGPNGVPGDVGDDDGDGREDWLDSPLTMMRPDPEELGRGDDIKVRFFVDRGDERAPTTQAFNKYKAMAESMGERKSIVSQDDVDSFEIDLGGEAVMTCLAANGFVREREEQVPNVNTENEKSLCFLLRYKGFDYLTGGDTIGRKHGQENAEVEGAIGAYIAEHDIRVDILHVNHHGANNASAAEFLADVEPEIAIISMGNDNEHRHPHKDALRRLAAAGVYRIYQTAWGTTEDVIPPEIRRHQAIMQDDIIVTTDGETYEISTSRSFKVDE